MSQRLRQKEMVDEFRSTIYNFNAVIASQNKDVLKLDDTLMLIELIPDALISDECINLTSTIILNTSFSNVVEFLTWLDEITLSIACIKYFTLEQSGVVYNRVDINLEDFLTDSNGMFFFPRVIIGDIKTKIERLLLVLNAVKVPEDIEYYNRHVNTYTSVITEVVFAIAELAGA